MRKRITLLAGLVLVLWVLWLPLASAQTLKIATLVPDGTSWMKEFRAAGDTITERTGGRVKIKYYPGGVMGNYNAVLRKIQIGQLQGAAFSAGDLISVYPDIEIYALPFLFRSYDEVDYVRERMDETIVSGLDAGGFVTLGISEAGFAYLMSDSPVSTVDELKRKKVWVPDNDVLGKAVFQTAGVAPVPLPMADVYTGLQTGLVDTFAGLPAAVIAFQWHTKAKYFMDEPLLYVIGLVVVQKKAFNKISADDQAIVREVFATTMDGLNTAARSDVTNAKDALKNQGIEFLRPDPAELQRWQDIASEAVAKLRADGVYSEHNLDRVQSLVDEYRAQAN
jgi:TRAP-type C4-dicarboxylate transport system substrate-binding protein